MREETVKIYQFDELSEEAQARAIEKEREYVYSNGIDWHEEILDSLQALFKACHGVTLVDYQLGGQGSYIKVKFDQDETAHLSGARAMAWLENNLLTYLRIPYTGKKRAELRKYGTFYRPGMIKPCPFTGYCADDDFLNSLRKHVKEGNELIDCFRWLANEYQRLLDAEYEYQTSEETIKENFEANQVEFYENGKRY